MPRLSKKAKQEWFFSYTPKQSGVHITPSAAFVYCTLAEVCKSLNCGHDKATRLFNELEMHGLIVKMRQGKGKPNRIYVKPFHKSADFR